MPTSSAARHFEHDEVSFYPTLLLSDAQRALSALADIDFRYEVLIEKLDGRHNSVGNPQSVRDRLLKRQTRERQRCIGKLAQIQARMLECVGMDLRA